MIRRAVVVATLLLAAGPAAASATTELNVIPHGQHEPGAAWASAPGHAARRAPRRMMYDRLTPLGRERHRRVLAPSADGTGYFKCAKLLAPRTTRRSSPTRRSPPRSRGTDAERAHPARRLRRPEHLLRHRRRRDLRRRLRRSPRTAPCCSTRRATTASPARSTSPARPRSTSSSGSTPTSRPRGASPGHAAADARRCAGAGTRGPPVLRDIDTYLAGINTLVQREPARPRGRSTAPTSTRSTRSRRSTSGRAAARRSPTRCSSTPRATSSAPSAGTSVYEDLRAAQRPRDADDDRAARAVQTDVPVKRARASCGSSRAPSSPPACRCPAPAPRPPASSHRGRKASQRPDGHGQPLRDRHAALRRRPADRLQLPRPDAGDGALRAAHRRARRDLRPVPGLHADRPRRGLRVDAHLGGRATSSTRTPRGCAAARARATSTRAAAADEDGQRRARSPRAARPCKVDVPRARSTGRSIGYARVARHQARRRARAQALQLRARDDSTRSSSSELTYGARARRAQDFIRAAAATPQTFNSFYADDARHRLLTTGPAAAAAQGRQPATCRPTAAASSSGAASWPASQAPAGGQPVDGMLVNWNNKPAKDFPAGDDRFGRRAATQRVDWLLARARAAAEAHARQRARRRERGRDRRPARRCLADVTAVLAKGTAPSPLAQRPRRRSTRWAANGGGWVDADGDGKIDGAGQAVIGRRGTGSRRAALCGRLGAQLVHALERASPRFDAAAERPVRRLAPVHRQGPAGAARAAGARAASTCATAATARSRACAQALWGAIDKAGARRGAGARGTDDPAQWTARREGIDFSPLPLAHMQYTNRPTGIHQVMQFAP